MVAVVEVDRTTPHAHLEAAVGVVVAAQQELLVGRTQVHTALTASVVAAAADQQLFRAEGWAATAEAAL